MNCQEFDNSLDEYWDDGLSPREKAEFLLHLDICPACRDLFQASERMMSDLRSLPRIECPPALADEILTRISDESVSSLRRAWPFQTDFFTLHRWSFATAMVTATAVVLLTLFFAPELIERTHRQHDLYSEQEVAMALHDVQHTLGRVNEVMMKGSSRTRDIIVDEVTRPLNKSIAMIVRPLTKEE